ncbi:hypothetical protein OG497_37790 [Streptomyces sp. NBC_01242]|uniref:DUF7239 family protein n=1 Tax=Streptomyces sp. NBC_01242 TaxID=2903795 RepID=UPI00224EAA35|nr:hypothetical protein [Streptomyces sp. NBC_01242]MCX4799611.1 hypothetical protein [Streptomyces sp. NBC_01242]
MTSTGQPDEERDSREDKLPKWAQDQLDLLRRRLADERTANARLRGDVGETDTLIRHYEMRPDQLLAPGSEVSFVPDLARPHREIACKMRNGQLMVHGETGLIIKPRMNNDVIIELES